MKRITSNIKPRSFDMLIVTCSLAAAVIRTDAQDKFKLSPGPGQNLPRLPLDVLEKLKNTPLCILRSSRENASDATARIQLTGSFSG